MKNIHFRFWYEGGKAKSEMVFYPETVFDSGQSKQRIAIDTYLMESEYPMMFTGLFDKNNKKIYEGDIVKLDYSKITEMEEIGIISFQYGSFGIENVDQVEFSELESYTWIGNGTGERTKILDEIEIIGNIFENPKLLKKLTLNGDNDTLNYYL